MGRGTVNEEWAEKRRLGGRSKLKGYQGRENSERKREREEYTENKKWKEEYG